MAGFAPGTPILLATQKYQYIEAVGLQPLQYFSYQFYVESDGTGSTSVIVANEADRPDLANIAYIEGVQVFDLAPFAC